MKSGCSESRAGTSIRRAGRFRGLLSEGQETETGRLLKAAAVRICKGVTMRRLLLSVAVLAVAISAGAAEVSGTVFHDMNGNGLWDDGEPGIAEVAVSNGEQVVLTDGQGRYSLEVRDPGIVFLIKPSGWMTPVDPVKNTPNFYYLHREDGSPQLRFGGVPPTGPLPESINFPLVPQDETGPVRILVLGDPQPRDVQEVHYLVQDLVAEVAGMEAAFGVSLGDNVFDELSVFEPLSHGLGRIGLPWHYVPGNHDMDFDAPTWEQAFETFQYQLGPSYYALAIGDVHIFSLNNIRLHVGERKYHAELGEQQRAFIGNYLKRVPREHLVLFLMHIPVMGMEDRDAFFDVIKDHPNSVSLSSHWHRHQHFFLGPDDGWHGEKPHHHIVQGTACGAWYRGYYDATGIPEAVMADGTPKGYAILTVEDGNYDLAYKATRRPASYQMDIHAPAEVSRNTQEQHEVIVNFFNGSERCRLEMRLNGGPWTAMEQFTGKAPFYLELYARQQLFVRLVAEGRELEELDDATARAIEAQFRPVIGRGIPDPADTNHLWRAMLPDGLTVGYNLVEVRAHDMFGRVHEARRYVYAAE